MQKYPLLGTMLLAGILTVTARAEPTIHVRREIYDVSANAPEIVDAYARAVKVMESRPADDPTSWKYQSNIHGQFPTDPVPDGTTAQALGWNQCQHGSYYFLAWHRMYLYYFERIVRKAAGPLPDHTEFALPYWDYSNPNRRKLPERFRLPADPEANRLFIVERDPDVNAGASLTPSVVSSSGALSLFRFNAASTHPPTPSFGGETAGPVHSRRPHGALESQPHDVIHGALGGDDGWMSDPDTAARDPIFWLHHANIDRLWDAWLRQGQNRKDPSDDKWLNATFTFFDEDKHKVTMSVRDILDSQSQLSYRYDDAAQPSPVGAPEVSAPVSTAAPSVAATSVVAPIKIQDGGSRIDLTVQPGANLATVAPAAPGQPAPEFIVNVAGLVVHKRPSGLLGIYLNLPDDVKSEDLPKYFAGFLPTFGSEARHHHDAAAAPMDPDEGGQLITATNAVKKLQAAGLWDGKKVTITIRPVSAVENGTKAVTAGDCSITNVSLLVR